MCRGSWACLAHQRAKIAEELARVETHALVLHAENSRPVDERGEERVVYVPVRSLLYVDAVSSRHLADLRYRPREKHPARGLRSVTIGIASQYLRCIPLRI